MFFHKSHGLVVFSTIRLKLRRVASLGKDKTIPNSGRIGSALVLAALHNAGDPVARCFGAD